MSAEDEIAQGIEDASAVENPDPLHYMRMVRDHQVRSGRVDKILGIFVLLPLVLREILLPFVDEHHRGVDLPVLLHLQQLVAHDIV